MSGGDQVETCAPSEVPFLLLLLHRRRLVVVDHAALALGGGREQHLLDDRRQRVGARSRPRRSAGSSRACGSAPSSASASRPARSGMRSSSTMISVPSRSTTGPLGREVERHDRDVLQVDVLPDVELGPVRQREHADALALVLARVVERPELGALVLRIPAVLRACGTRRCAPWRGSSPRRAARRRTPRRSRTCRAPASAPCVFITSVCTAEPCVNGLMPCATPSGLMCTISSSPCCCVISIAERVSSRGTSRSCRRAAAGTAAAPDRTPSSPGAASPRCPCRSNTASPACSHSATTSRMMWMLSASRRCRCVRRSGETSGLSGGVEVRHGCIA